MKETQIEELKKGLEKTTELLNKQRGLWNKYVAGQKYSLENEEETGSVFKIVTQYRQENKRGLCADIEISEKGLTGIICPMKSLKPVASFLHAFSHRFNIPLGFIGSSLKYFS